MLGKGGTQRLGDLSEWKKKAGQCCEDTRTSRGDALTSSGPLICTVHGLLTTHKGHMGFWLLLTLVLTLTPTPDFQGCCLPLFPTPAVSQPPYFPISSLGSSRLASVCLLVHSFIHCVLNPNITETPLISFHEISHWKLHRIWYVSQRKSESKGHSKNILKWNNF